MKVLAVYSHKGGVGKTSAAVNLAYCAAQERRRVLVWDLDPQAAASYYLRVAPNLGGGAKTLVKGGDAVRGAILGTGVDNVDLLPGDVALRHLERRLDAAKGSRRRLGRVADLLAEEYDLVIVDCPPALGLVSDNLLRAAGVLLTPVVPAPLSLRTVGQLDAILDAEDTSWARALRRRCFFSMVDGHRPLHNQTIEDVLAERADVLRTVIPEVPEVELMGVHRAPVAAFAPRSTGAEAYADLWRELQLSLHGALGA